MYFCIFVLIYKTIKGMKQYVYTCIFFSLLTVKYRYILLLISLNEDFDGGPLDILPCLSILFIVEESILPALLLNRLCIIDFLSPDGFVTGRLLLECWIISLDFSTPALLNA